MTSESAAVEFRPVPRVDHVMVLIDATAYRDVAASAFLGERFGRLRRKDADSSVAGAYATLGIAGENTLVELFGSTMPGSAPLVGGLVFSFEEPGSSPAARTLLDESGRVRYYHDLVRRAVPGSEEQQPWYHLINVDLGEASPLLLFLNEVTPEYFRAIGAQPADGGRFRRRDYLDAVLGGPADGPRLLRDIAGITLAVRAERARRIADALGALGYTAAGDAGERVLTGPGLTIRLVIEEAGPERVAEIQLALVPGRRDQDTPAELRFGETSRLVFGEDDTARWIFGPMGRPER